MTFRRGRCRFGRNLAATRQFRALDEVPCPAMVSGPGDLPCFLLADSRRSVDLGVELAGSAFAAQFPRPRGSVPGARILPAPISPEVVAEDIVRLLTPEAVAMGGIAF